MWYNIHILKYLWDETLSQLGKKSARTIVILWHKDSEEIGCGHILTFINFYWKIKVRIRVRILRK